MKYKGLFIVLVASLFVWGCLRSPQPFDGTWTASGDEDGFGWYITYTFDRGSYEIEGYPPLGEAGRYEILEVLNQKYTLSLDPTEGERAGTEAYEVELTLSEDGKTLLIGTTELRKSK